MLKIRMMGTEDEIEEFIGFMEEEQSSYELDNKSDMQQCKRSTKHVRMYAELKKNSEDKEN